MIFVYFLTGTDRAEIPDAPAHATLKPLPRRTPTIVLVLVGIVFGTFFSEFMMTMSNGKAWLYLSAAVLAYKIFVFVLGLAKTDSGLPSH